MSIYEKTRIARALLYWAKNNNGNECYYLEDRMYAVADGDMVIILTADSYDEAKRKAKARHTQERPQGKWIDKRTIEHDGEFYCSNCDEVAEWLDGGSQFLSKFCPNCGAEMEVSNDG